MKQGGLLLSKSTDSQLPDLESVVSSPSKNFKVFNFVRGAAKKTEDLRSMSDKFELQMDNLIVNCFEHNFKDALNKVLQEFLNLNPQFKGCSYRILMNENTFDVLCPIISEVRDGKLSDEIGSVLNTSTDEGRLIKILNNFETFKDIYNDP